MSAHGTPSVSTTRGKAKSAQRWLLWAGIMAPILFVTVFTIDGLVKPGYSASDEAISYLDVGTNGWIQRANFILFGLLLIAFLVGYVRRMRPILGQNWLYTASTFLALSDLGWIMGGLFIPNPYLAPQVVWPAVLHQIAVIIVFLPFAIACFILGVKFVRTRGWRAYGCYCLVLALPVMVFPIGTIAYLINQNVVGNVNSPGSGTMDRVVLVIGPLAWYVVSAMIGMLRADQEVETSKSLEE